MEEETIMVHFSELFLLKKSILSSIASINNTKHANGKRNRRINSFEKDKGKLKKIKEKINKLLISKKENESYVRLNKKTFTAMKEEAVSIISRFSILKKEEIEKIYRR